MQVEITALAVRLSSLFAFKVTILKNGKKPTSSFEPQDTAFNRIHYFLFQGHSGTLSRFYPTLDFSLNTLKQTCVNWLKLKVHRSFFASIFSPSETCLQWNPNPASYQEFYGVMYFVHSIQHCAVGHIKTSTCIRTPYICWLAQEHCSYVRDGKARAGRNLCTHTSGKALGSTIVNMD